MLTGQHERLRCGGAVANVPAAERADYTVAIATRRSAAAGLDGPVPIGTCGGWWRRGCLLT
jgi:hypothetical protein